MKFSKTLIIASMFGLSTMALADDQSKAEKKVGQAVDSTKTTFFDMIDKDSVTVSFSKGQASLSDSEKSNLKTALAAAKRDVKVDRILVAAWSDSDLPRSSEVKLSKEANDLAESRGDAIENYLDSLDAGDVEIFNMAEHANWFERMFKTDEAQIKKSMKGFAIDDQSEKTLAERLSAKGGPSKAVVLIITENSYLSH